MSPAAIRGLVVDDDPEICELLSNVLRGLGVEPDSASDGREAERQLRGADYDVMFLDLRLPVMSGEFLVQLVNQGAVRRPGSIVLMSGVRTPTPEAMSQMGVAGFLAKPFALPDIRASIEHALGQRIAASIATRAAATAAETAARPVLVAGSGLWAQALGQVVERSGGTLIGADSTLEALSRIRAFAPSVAVIGTPFRHEDLLQLCAAVRAEAALSSTQVVVALARWDLSLESDLMAAGATRVIAIDGGLAELSSDIAQRAHLTRRTHRRAKLASAVLLHAGQSVIGGYAIDLCEGGIGLSRVTECPPKQGELQVEFALPEEEELVIAKSEFAWSREADDGMRAGVRFVDLGERDRRRIRHYVQRTAAAA